MDPIRLLGTRGGKDKLGVWNLQTKWNADTEDEAIRWLNSNPSYRGLPFEGGDFDQSEDGSFDVFINYQGFTDDGGGPTDIARATYRFGGTMDQERIETHPKFIELKEIYGWDEEKRMFPEYAPEGANKGNNTEGARGTDKSSTEKKRSELAGVEAWLVVGAEYSITYSARNVPAGIWRGLGSIITTPPGLSKFGVVQGNRKFLKLTPEVEGRGNAWQITLRYKLGGPYSIAKDIYSAGQLDPSEAGAGRDTAAGTEFYNS